MSVFIQIILLLPKQVCSGHVTSRQWFNSQVFCFGSECMFFCFVFPWFGGQVIALTVCVGRVLFRPFMRSSYLFVRYSYRPFCCRLFCSPRSISPWSFSPLPVDSMLNAWIMGHNLYLLGSGTVVSLSILGLGREGKSRRARKTPLYYPNIIQPAGSCTTGLIE
jgi:hypothetical protein